MWQHKTGQVEHTHTSKYKLKGHRTKVTGVSKVATHTNINCYVTKLELTGVNTANKYTETTYYLPSILFTVTAYRGYWMYSHSYS